MSRHREMCVHPHTGKSTQGFCKRQTFWQIQPFKSYGKIDLEHFPLSISHWLFFYPFTCRVQLLSEVLNNVVGSRVIPVLTTILHSKMMLFQLPYKSHINHSIFCCTFFSPPGHVVYLIFSSLQCYTRNDNI